MTDSLRIGWKWPEVRSGGVAEYRRRPVLRQELKGKEEEEVAYRTVIVAMRCVIVSIYLPKMWSVIERLSNEEFIVHTGE